MTDAVKAWIQDRRAARVPNSTLSISDAHNNLPRALDAIEQVLGLHRRAVDIFEPSEFCAACSTDRRTVKYPCATVRAIEGAIHG